MEPDFHAFVLAAYAASALIVGAMVIASLRAWRRVKRQSQAMENET